jgi:hypothetical protein
MRNRRVLQHVQRLKHGRLEALIDWSSVNVGDILYIAELYRQGDMSGAAEEMYLQGLRGKEKVCAEGNSTAGYRDQKYITQLPIQPTSVRKIRVYRIRVFYLT